MRLLLASSTLIVLAGLAASTVSCFGGSNADDSGGDDSSSDAGKADAKKDTGADDDASDGGDEDAAEASGPVSLKTDLMPKMQTACGIASICHGASDSKQVWLGSKATPIPVATLYANLKKKSVELPTMPYVTAGDPTKSYMVLKLEATDDTITSVTCPKNAIQPASGSCGVGMPQGSAPWEYADLFRAWVEQGANNN